LVLRNHPSRRNIFPQLVTYLLKSTMNKLFDPDKYDEEWGRFDPGPDEPDIHKCSSCHQYDEECYETHFELEYLCDKCAEKMPDVFWCELCDKWAKEYGPDEDCLSCYERRCDQAYSSYKDRYFK